MAEAGISGFGKAVRSLCSLRAKSRLLYAHDKVYGCVSSQRRHFSARTDGVPEYDVVIIGTGIVGLGTAMEMINRYPNLKYAVLDKETKVAAHQSGNNSGVIHAGIYYLPGTLKAKLCVEGAALMVQYCDANKVPYKKCGKLIVAVDQVEVSRLDDLYDRSQKNSVPDVRMLDPDQIKEIEPNCTVKYPFQCI
ncbi:L-2-hydroxyglutarate dehydrogenase, mitochondrial [Lamellibrachia satsuma]|nr:L-2-hydroxyglutarate dehydrogenase, mitochondrial [Lamellibrachia satsuma]